MRNFILCALSLCVGAGATPVLQFDQFGNGLIDSTPVSGALQTDPGPGGPPDALTYPLTFSGVQGDLILTDPNFSDLPMEIIRFNGDGTLIFYAGNMPGSLAYVSNPPASTYGNIAIVSDVGPEDINTATYTPTAGQPGYDPSNPTYIFFNGVAGINAPEPSTTATVLISLLALLTAAALRRRRYSSRLITPTPYQPQYMRCFGLVRSAHVAYRLEPRRSVSRMKVGSLSCIRWIRTNSGRRYAPWR